MPLDGAEKQQMPSSGAGENQMPLTGEGKKRMSSTGAGKKRLPGNAVLWICLAAAAALTVFRFVLANILGCWFAPEQYWDSGLFVRYSALKDHFGANTLLVSEAHALLKDMGFPFFLAIAYVLPISYVNLLTLVWVAAAALMARAVRRLFNGGAVACTAAYAFVLYTPAAFDWFIGTCLYRNSILAPFYFLTFALMLNIAADLYRGGQKTWRLIVYAVALGLVAGFTMYIKEDGMWILAAFAAYTLFLALIVLIRTFKKIISWKELIRQLVGLCIPVLLIAAVTAGYKGLNYRYFGVREINTRTEGEIAGFCNRVYKIASDDRTPSVWAPTEAVAQAVDASPTLSADEEFVDALFTSPMLGGDIESNPIQGDFLGWGIRDALVATGQWWSEPDVQDFFRQVNEELDAAFADGTLEKDTKIQLVSSAGGRTPAEIISLRREAGMIFQAHVLLKAYAPGGFNPQLQANSTDYDEGLVDMAERRIGQRLTRATDPDSAEEGEKMGWGNARVQAVFCIYKVLQPVLFALSLAAIVFAIVLACRKTLPAKRRKRFVFISVIIAANYLLAFAYSVAIGWFTSFLDGGAMAYDTVMKYYSPGAVPLYMIGELLGAFLFALCAKTAVRSRRHSAAAAEQD